MSVLATELEKVLCKKCRLEFAHDALFCPNCGTAKNRSSDTDPLTGSTVGERYQLIRQIGQGASGAIYLAEHVTLRRKVVVKVLHHELSRDDLAIERFRREATTVGDLDNDHIVQILDFGRTSDGRLYLAMEYLEGQTLADLMEEKGRLDTKLVVDVLTQLGEALIEAHAIGYVHRDLRPRNMFLALRRTRVNYLKLLDFGLAKLVEQEGEAASTSLGMTFGDPHYMSPEQARGEPVDRRADIYSMGCIAYEMLTGQPPFHGGKVFDVLTRHVEEKPRSLAEVAPETPPWLERAVMRCLAKRADDRYITVYRLVEALQQGTDSGVIMSDAVARRRPTNPPASVSRAMERLALRNDEPALAAPAAESPVSNVPVAESGPAADTVPTPQVIIDDPFSGGTMAGSPAPAPASVSKSGGVGSQTVLGLGRPSSGKEIENASTLPSSPDAMAAAGKERTQRASKSPSAASSANLSAVWYADGDSLEDGKVLSDRDRAKLSKARGDTPSRTGLMAVSDDEFYEEEGFESSSKLKFIIAGVGVAIAGIVIYAMTGSSDKPKPADKPAPIASAPLDSATPPSPEPASAPGADAAVTAVVEIATPADAGPPAAVETDAKPVLPVASNPKPRDPKVRTPKKPRDPIVRTPKPRNPKPPVDQPLDPFATGPSAADKEQATRLVGEGTRDLQAGDILGAATNFNKARALNPRNGQAIAGLGEIALSQGAYASAINHLSKASKMRPKSVRIWIFLGEAYMGKGNQSKAADAFKKALKLRPDSARARNGYNEATGN